MGSFTPIPPSSSLMKITILVVDDDATTLAVVSAMLKKCHYQVMSVQGPFEAISTLRTCCDFDIVLTDLHMPGMNGLQFKQYIDKEFRLPVIIMSADDQQSVIIESLASGIVAYIVKPMKLEDLMNISHYVIKNQQGKSPIIQEIESTNQERRGSASLGNITNKYPDHDRRHPTTRGGNSSSPSLSPSSENDDEDETKKRKHKSRKQHAPKQPKLQWDNDMHELFVKAISVVGWNRAVPKKIHTFMNIPWLTRQNVASHLQKYRDFLKKVSKQGLGPSNAWTERELRSTFAICHATMIQQQQYAEILREYNLVPGSTFSSVLNPPTGSFNRLTKGLGYEVGSSSYGNNFQANGVMPSQLVNHGFNGANSNPVGGNGNMNGGVDNGSYGNGNVNGGVDTINEGVGIGSYGNGNMNGGVDNGSYGNGNMNGGVESINEGVGTGSYGNGNRNGGVDTINEGVGIGNYGDGNMNLGTINGGVDTSNYGNGNMSGGVALGNFGNGNTGIEGEIEFDIDNFIRDIDNFINDIDNAQNMNGGVGTGSYGNGSMNGGVDTVNGGVDTSSYGNGNMSGGVALGNFGNGNTGIEDEIEFNIDNFINNIDNFINDIDNVCDSNSYGNGNMYGGSGTTNGDVGIISYGNGNVNGSAGIINGWVDTSNHGNGNMSGGVALGNFGDGNIGVEGEIEFDIDNFINDINNGQNGGEIMDNVEENNIFSSINASENQVWDDDFTMDYSFGFSP